MTLIKHRAPQRHRGHRGDHGGGLRIALGQRPWAPTHPAQALLAALAVTSLGSRSGMTHPDAFRCRHVPLTVTDWETIQLRLPFRRAEQPMAKIPGKIVAACARWSNPYREPRPVTANGWAASHRLACGWRSIHWTRSTQCFGERSEQGLGGMGRRPRPLPQSNAKASAVISSVTPVPLRRSVPDQFLNVDADYPIGSSSPTLTRSMVTRVRKRLTFSLEWNSRRARASYSAMVATVITRTKSASPVTK